MSIFAVTLKSWMSCLRPPSPLWLRVADLSLGKQSPPPIPHLPSDLMADMCRCGKCRRYLKYIAARPHRMYCPHCNETYSLPSEGAVKLYKEIKCPLDGFELLVFSSPTKVGLWCILSCIHVLIHPCSHTWCAHTATTSLHSRGCLRGWVVTSVLIRHVSMRYHNREWTSAWNVTVACWSWNHTSRLEAPPPNGRSLATVPSQYTFTVL